MAKSKPLGNQLFSGIAGLDMSMNIDIPRTEESANTADVAKPPVTTLDAATPKEPTEVIAEAAGPDAGYSSSIATQETPVTMPKGYPPTKAEAAKPGDKADSEESEEASPVEKPKVAGSKRGRKSNKEKAEMAAAIPKYEIKPASVGVPVKFLVSEDEKDNFENALYSIRKLTGNKKMKNIRHFFLQGAYAQMFDMYCCRSCHRVWTALPGLAGEAPGTWDTCTCGSKDVEHLKNYD